MIVAYERPHAECRWISVVCGVVADGVDGDLGALLCRRRLKDNPVSFSLAASSIDDVPRGISFVLNRNRVNVAVSRTQCAAYTVRSPQLTDYLPASLAGLVELGAFLALTELS